MGRGSTKDGTYEFGDLPAGEFLVFGSHSEWFPPPGRRTPTAVEVRPGKTEFYQIKMLKKATVFGTVLGPQDQPVIGATVAVPTAMKHYHGELFDVTKTDRNGRFKLRTACLAHLKNHSRATIAAVADRMGTGSVSLGGLKEGEIRRQSEQESPIRLSGAMRIWGHVKGPHTNPIARVYVYVTPNLWPNSRTDESGFFNLTWFPIPRHEKFFVYFRTERPHDGGLGLLDSPSNRKPARNPKVGVQYYLHDRVHVVAEHNREVRLDQTLVPTDLLTVSGQVTDSAGDPIEHAILMLFVGNVAPAGTIDPAWVRRMHPELGGGGTFRPPAYEPLCRTVTDKRGRYTMSVARASAKSLSIRYHGREIDATQFSLGVDSLRGERKLMRDIHFRDGNKKQIVNVRLP